MGMRDKRPTWLGERFASGGLDGGGNSVNERQNELHQRYFPKILLTLRIHFPVAVT